MLQPFNEPITTAAWTPDGASFVTGSLDKKGSLNLWSSGGEKQYTWPAAYRTQDVAIAPDGRRLVVVSAERTIVVYDLASRAQQYSLRLKTDMTCVSIARDSRHMLVNMADNELQLIDLASAEIVQRFLGQKQGKYVIRSTFGGADENLVISGSEGTTPIFSRVLGLRMSDAGLIERCAQMARSTSSTASAAPLSKRSRATPAAASMPCPGTRPTPACSRRRATTRKSGCKSRHLSTTRLRRTDIARCTDGRSPSTPSPA